MRFTYLAKCWAAFGATVPCGASATERSFGSAAMRHTDARGVMIYRCNRFQIIAPTKPKMYPITPVITISVTAASGSNGLTK